MPIRNRVKPEGLKLQIPEQKVSPRDWSLPYRRKAAGRWRFGLDATEVNFGGTFRFHYYSRSTNATYFTSRNVGHIPQPQPQAQQQQQQTPEKENEKASSCLHSSSSPDAVAPGGGIGLGSGSGGCHDDNFSLLEKNSQRRSTLLRVLQQDKADICSQWHRLLLNEAPDTGLTQSHLQVLMDGLRGFIPERNRVSLETAIYKLKEELDYGGVIINQISMALYVFQDAVNSVLRSHSIRRHWIFALDTLVSNAVQAAITVLSPELGQHLGNPPHQPQAADRRMEADNDGASTSVISNHSHPVLRCPGQQRQQLQALRKENSLLLDQLLEMQHNYQALLKHNLAEQRLHLQTLSQSMQQQSAPRPGPGGPSGRVPSSGAPGAGRPDAEMLDWLIKLNLNQDAIQKFVSEELTLEDVSNLMTKEDLRRLGLKAGPELRVWRAILDLRTAQKPRVN